MLNRQPQCVHVATTIVEAEVVAVWLRGQGIAADVMGEAILGGLDLTPWAGPGASPRGIEVWVLDTARIEEARTLLAEHADEIAAAPAAEPAPATPQEPLDVRCDECDVTTTYPAEEVGTTQECPTCGAYVDVEVAQPDEDAWWNTAE